MKNTKQVQILIPNEVILKRINSTHAFNRLSRLNLKVGVNMETVNYKQYHDMKRLFPIINVEVKDLNN